MRKVVGGFLATILFIVLVFLGTKAYFFSIGYTQPLLTNGDGVAYVAKVDGKQFDILDGEGKWKQSFLTGVDIGLGAPGAFPGEFAIDYDTYFDWLTQIGDMGSNVIRVYTPQAPGFYHALYEYNRVAASPLYLIQGVYMNETDVVKYADVFAPDSTTASEMRQDIVDCVNMLHGNAVIGAQTGKASGIYQYDVSKYVIGWILGIECEASLVDGTNNAHPDINTYDGQYLYTENASPFEVFIAQMEDLAIRYETEQYRMQRPVAFCNWVTTDPLTHPNEPRDTEDQASINVEHIKAKAAFTPGFFASYHVYPYYPDFLNFPSGDAQTDADPYYAYVKSLVDFHSMPVLISEFGLPTSRGVTHVNALTGLNQGGNSEQQQSEGLSSMLTDIYHSGCMGGVVFAWHDEWFKTSWNTMDYDDSAVRPKWHNVESSEENFGLIGFSAFPSIQIDGDFSDWKASDALAQNPNISANWDESYLYLRLNVDDFNNQKYYIPIDTIGNEGSARYKSALFTRNAGFVLVLDGETGTHLLVDPYYNPNYKRYGQEVFPSEDLLTFAITGNGNFIESQQVICNRMVMPYTGQIVPVQLWNTGKMIYGNSNPISAQYDSRADFCAVNGSVEIRIPWMLLNFADPSSGEILGNLHTSSTFPLIKIKELYIGLGKASGNQTIPMTSYQLPTWAAFSYTQHFKQAYYTLSKVFPQYSTYAINMGAQMQEALKLRDARLLYVRLGRQMRKTDIIWYILILAMLLVVYLYILLVTVNIRMNRIVHKHDAEKQYIRTLAPLPPAEIDKKMHYRYLCTTKGLNMLCELLTEEYSWTSGANLIAVLRSGKYAKWMKKQLHTPDLMSTSLVIRMAGLLRLREYESQIVPLMEKHPEHLDLQYVGFLALSMMGNRDSIIQLCSTSSYTKSLSYRCLKEIFSVYTGDKVFLYEKLLNSPDFYIRRIVIKNIGEGFTEYSEKLLGMLNIEDNNFRCDLIRTLGQLRYAPAGEPIAAFVQNENWALRNAAVIALASIDAKRYLKQITNGLCDREWWVRYNSAKELCIRLPMATLSDLLTQLHDRFAIEILTYTIQETALMGKGAQ